MEYSPASFAILSKACVLYQPAVAVLLPAAYAKKAGESFAADKEKTWKKVLIIGASTGYGLASRIAAAFTCKADTIGVMFERPAAGKRTATAGWYNTQAFDKCFSSDTHLFQK